MRPSVSSRFSPAGPLALILGLLAAQAVIYASTWWRDGALDPGVWALKRQALRALPATLPGAALVGVLLQEAHRAALASKVPGGWPILVALPRLFLHFPCYGFILLVQFIGQLGLGMLLGWLGRRRRAASGQAPPEVAFERSFVLWMLLGPMARLKDAEGRAIDFPVGPGEVFLCCLKLLPWVLGVVWVWTGAVGEESGERVDPFLLSLAATVWVGDLLLLIWMHRPPGLLRR